MYEEEIKTKTETENNQEFESMTGRYVTLGKLADEFKSREAAINYFSEAMARVVKSRKLFQGKEFVVYNTWTKMYDILYVRQKSGTSWEGKQTIAT